MQLQMSKEEKLEIHNAFLIVNNIQLQLEKANAQFQGKVFEFCQKNSVKIQDIIPNGINFETGLITFKDKEKKDGKTDGGKRSSTTIDLGKKT